MEATTSPLAHVLDVLACPVCGGLFSPRGGSLVCAAGHTFDVARQGHVNLLGTAAPANADTPAMLAARDRVLEAGWYDAIDDAVAELVLPGGAPQVVVEAGAGAGHHLAQLLTRAGSPARGLGLDVSPAAARTMSRRGLAAAVADTWRRLPVQPGSVDVLLCVFAPRNPAEFARVLAPGGRLVVVTPTPAHLASLRASLGLLDVPEGKHDRLASTVEEVGLTLTASRHVRTRDEVSALVLADVVAMGPNAFHAPAAPRTDGVLEVDVTVDLVTAA